MSILKNNRIRKFILAVMIITMVLGNSFSVTAAEPKTEAVYDLQKGGTQIFFIENENGETEEIIIEEIVSNARMDAGTYRITCNASAWTAGFYAIIVNDEIQAVHSPFYSITNGEITEKFLVKNSNVKATYSFVHEVNLFRFNTGVVATISNSQLKINKI